MRKLLPAFIISFFLLTGELASAQKSVVFSEGNLTFALKTAKAQNKPVFLMSYATWCSHCNKMKKEVFNDAAVADFFTANFVNVWADGEQTEGISLKKRYQLKSYPAFAFIDGDGEMLYKLSGEFTAAELIAEAKNALNPRLQLPYLEKQFNADPGNADKCLAYITTLLKGKNREELSVPTHKYLATQTDAQLLSETNWRIISNGVSDISSREFQYVIKNKQKFEKLTSKQRVDAKIKNIVTEYIRPSETKPDIKEYNKKRVVVKNMTLPEADALLFKNDLQVAEMAEDWNFYKSVTTESIEKQAWNDAALLKEISQNYYDHLSDTASLEMAAKWMEQSLKHSVTYDGKLLQAKLYRKAGRANDASAAAKEAKNLAVEMGWDSKDADALLNEINAK